MSPKSLKAGAGELHAAHRLRRDPVHGGIDVALEAQAMAEGHIHLAQDPIVKGRRLLCRQNQRQTGIPTPLHILDERAACRRDFAAWRHNMRFVDDQPDSIRRSIVVERFSEETRRLLPVVVLAENIEQISGNHGRDQRLILIPQFPQRQDVAGSVLQEVSYPQAVRREQAPCAGSRPACRRWRFARTPRRSASCCRLR